ncbi:hypothetical protein EPI10_020307 [Gossypium australe]|uniref:Uncharacterized protein n=1 Tax=Gossypium australe TaxID=47621 RepID=A0A5B6WEV2_9ROSI|nr:hypothetical protein EPI10_020307 [Gossypium australe]
MHYCNVNHYRASKRVLRYIKGTLNHGVKFVKTEKIKLLRYSESDWVGSTENMKNTSCYFFTLGLSVFCWNSKNSQDQLIDILTKPLGKMRFEKLCYDIGVQNMEVKEEYCKVTLHVIMSLEHKSMSSLNLQVHQDCKLTKLGMTLKLQLCLASPCL